MTIEIERATNLPMGRPPRNNLPLPVESVFPMTADGAENLRKTMMPNTKDAPLTQQEAYAVVSRILLPVIFDDLGFMGMDAPDIRIVAHWMPETAPAPRCRMPVVTRGRVQILPFSLAFATLCRTAGASTTAHRRYKDAFAGERIHIAIDADRNAVRMYLADDLRDALDVGWKAWMQGR